MPFPLNFSLCLSRAYLGKMIIFTVAYEKAQKKAVFAPVGELAKLYQ